MVKGVSLQMQDYVASLDFQIIHLARVEVYLGREWLYNLGPNVSHSYQDKTYKSYMKIKK